MSLSQLNDPSMREALGVEDTPEGEPTLAYTNNGTTSTLQVGAAINTVAITSVPILDYNSESTAQISPLAIDVRIDPPNASPLNNVRIAEFHWIKQDPNNQDKYGYFNLGDGFFKIGSEWLGFGPQSVVLEGANVLLNLIGPQNGSAGFDITHGGNTVLPATTRGRLWMDTAGQLNFNHLLPATSTGNQVLYRPTSCEALSTVSTAVGAGFQVILPINSLGSTTSQGGVNHFAIAGGNSVQLSATNANAGIFFVTASIAIDTVTAGAQLGVAHFKVNGVDVANSASSHTINASQQNSIIIQAFLTLNPNDAVSVALSSTDAALTATTYPAVVGPPTIPQECAMVLVLTRIA